MKKLILVRHAQAEGSSPDGDLGRSLTENGKADMLKVAEELKEDFFPDIILSSPAKRAFETANIIAHITGFDPLKIVYHNDLYNQDFNLLFDILNELEENNVLVVGHNPNFELISDYLSEDGFDDFPTGSILGLIFQIDSWAKIQPLTGKIMFFITP